MKFSLLIILFFFNVIICVSQQDSTIKIAKKDTFVYNPKAEISFDGKRYRVYNSWLSLGAGANINSHWQQDEKNFGADFNFHIKQYYFGLGGFMSGRNFYSMNNYSAHAVVGLRKEKPKYNLFASIGPSISYFRRPLKDSISYNLQNVYNRVGGYICLEAVYKIKYDVGIGGQIFCDYNDVQTIYGVRLIAYFSGAYRGIKYGRGTTKKK